MAFWSTNTIEPLRKRSFTIQIDGADGFEFLAKSVDKPTVETDVNEYRLNNQIYKFPSIPRWNDITIKFVDTKDKSISTNLYDMFFESTGDPAFWNFLEEGCPTAIKKDTDSVIAIVQHDADGGEVSRWELVGVTIRSINFGDNDYSSDDFVEIEMVIAYDYATLST